MLSESHPVSFLRMSMYVRASLLGFLFPCFGAQRIMFETGFSYLLADPREVCQTIQHLSCAVSSGHSGLFLHACVAAESSFSILGVVFQASQQCNSTDSTVATNRHSLNFLGRDDFQILDNLLHALHAAALRYLLSFAVLSNHAPRYLKSLPSSSFVPSFFWRLLILLWLNDINFVLPAFIFSPTFVIDVSTLCSSSCAWYNSSDNNAMSSAKSKSVTISGPTRLLRLFDSWKPRSSSFPSIAIHRA